MNTANATPGPRYVTLAEAADYAGFSIRTIRRYISQGLLIGYRVGPKHIRIDLNEVDGMFSTIPTGIHADAAGHKRSTNDKEDEMSDAEPRKTYFEHIDRAGDRLEITGGGSGATINARGADGEHVVVVIRHANIPRLIEALDSILETEGIQP